MLVYLSLASCALLHCAPGQSCTRSKRLEGSSEDVANSKGYELLQPNQRENMCCYHYRGLLPQCVPFVLALVQT